MKQCLMTTQTVKYVDFTKTQNSKYLEIKENIILYASRATSLQKIVL